MSLSAKIREQLISSFRAELAEHVQTMNDGLLALEQNRVQGQERQNLLENIFRAAHSLKGAARAVGVTVIEQLAHSLESVLDAMQHETIELSSPLFTACYQALDAVQAVQATYEAGETTPPMAAIQALADLEPFRPAKRSGKSAASAQSEEMAPAQAARKKAPPLGAVLNEQLQSAWQGPPASEAPVPAVEERGEGGLDVQPPLQEAATVEEMEEGDRRSPAQASTEAGTSGLGNHGTIRVSVDKLDTLMNQLDELLAAKIRAEQQLTQIQELQQQVAEWQKEWLLIRGVYNRLVRQGKNGLLSAHRMRSIDALRADWFGLEIRELPQRTITADIDLPAVSGKGNKTPGSAGQDKVLRELSRDTELLLSYVDANQAQMGSIGALVNEVARRYASDTTYMGMVIDDLEKEIKRVRMLPLSTITGTFGRMVRDLAQAAGKEASLQLEGTDTELDKQVLEQIKDPLVHLLRNAVDHGIEPPAKRQKQGKPRAGKIVLTAEQLGKNILIRIADDGVGLDMEAIRAALARRGVADTETLSKADLKEAIFRAGVSTNALITDISGRGVGLDVVRRNVEALHGTVDVDSTPGVGTTFILSLPLRLATSRGLFVHAAGETFAIPLNNIQKIERYTPDQIISLEGRSAVRYNGEPLALVWLSDVLDLPAPENMRSTPDVLAVIVAAAERRMAFVVDELLGEQEMVIKPLGKQLVRVGGIAGATVMGDRKAVLVLHAADLIKLATRSSRRSVLEALNQATAPEQQVRRQILVVDDSITTRTLEKNILEAAGYLVRLATDGREALNEIAARGVPDLVVTDIAMPYMNGFELTTQIRADEQIKHLPVILVTSLDSPEDKARGVDVGADAYIVKSSFDQDNLLDTIAQLI